jgi:hypothetical protein
LPFTGIPHLCRGVMNRFKPAAGKIGLSAILEADQWARREAETFVSPSKRVSVSR